MFEILRPENRQIQSLNYYMKGQDDFKLKLYLNLTTGSL